VRKASKAARANGYIVMMMPTSASTPYLSAELTKSSTVPWQWIGDRKKAYRWPSVRLARLTIDCRKPGWRAELADMERPVVWMRVVPVRKKPLWAEVTYDDCCTFLGHVRGMDLYFHASRKGRPPTLTARRSNAMRGYVSAPAIAENMRAHSFELRIARRIAVKRGMITLPKPQRVAAG
jgi:hypothetical protein